VRTAARNQSRSLVLAAAVILGLLPGLSLLDTQFRGEDEVMTLLKTQKIVRGLRHLDPVATIASLATADHPPGRFLLAAPFVLVLGPNEIAMRLPNVLVWAATVAVATDVGLRLGGMWAGVFTASLLGLSGLFDVQGMSHGHGVATFWIMLLVRHMINDAGWGLIDPPARRQYFLGALYCAAGFLWFTSLLPICALYHAMHALAALQRRTRPESLRSYVRVSTPFAGFYLIYYAVFLGVPAYVVRGGLYPEPFGQLHQNAGRWVSAHLNVASLAQNLQALNWYFLPFVSWLLLISGMFSQARRSPQIFVLLAPYALLFSFFIYGNTPQHFFAYFTWLAPFGIAVTFNTLARAGRCSAIVVFAILTLAVAGWTYVGHVRRYTAEGYPERLLHATWGATLWRNNVVRPLDAISRDLQAVLGPDDRFIVLSDGALPLYYFPDQRYLSLPPLASDRDPVTQRPCTSLVGPPDQRGRVRAAVSWTDQSFCSDEIERVLRYPGSDLKVTLFSAS
jgi:hypothetical protein